MKEAKVDERNQLYDLYGQEKGVDEINNHHNNNGPEIMNSILRIKQIGP